MRTRYTVYWIELDIGLVKIVEDQMSELSLGLHI